MSILKSNELKEFSYSNFKGKFDHFSFGFFFFFANFFKKIASCLGKASRFEIVFVVANFSWKKASVICGIHIYGLDSSHRPT
jgi:hypothetical protein